MKIVASDKVLPELEEYLTPFARHFVRSEGRENMDRYSTGLLSGLPRKNGTTIAASVPNTNDQRLQSLLTTIQWDEAALNRQRVEQLRDDVRLGDGVLILDDTGFPKQGNASVGVARQYCSELGKVDNCQVAVTCHYADSATSWPVNGQLYLPKEWTEDAERRKRAGVPKDVTFQTKPKIALQLIDEAIKLGIPHEAIVTDASYGGDDSFLSGLESRHKRYVAAVPCDFQVIPQVPPETPTEASCQRAEALLKRIPLSEWRTIRWREGTKGWLRKKFVAVRVYRAVDGIPKHLGWLIGERPGYKQKGEWKFYFANFPQDTPLERMVRYAHHRWQIDRFYQDAKQLLGWGDYQGRKWIGFHRHAILVMLTYSFLVTVEWKHRYNRPRTRGRPRSPFSPRRDRNRQAIQQIHKRVIDSLWEMAIEYYSRK